jgi:hypothetical protein
VSSTACLLWQVLTSASVFSAKKTASLHHEMADVGTKPFVWAPSNDLGGLPPTGFPLKYSNILIHKKTYG